MSFFRVPTQNYLAYTPDSCKVSLTVLSKSTVGIRLAFGSNLLLALGAECGDRLNILWGRDADVGKVLLVKAELGVAIKSTRQCKTDAAYLVFSGLPKEKILGPHGKTWTFLAKPSQAAATTWSQAPDGGGVIITLPAAWWSVEISPSTTALKSLTGVPMPRPREVA